MYFYKNQGTDVGGTADKATLVNVLVIGRGTLTAKLIVLDSKVGSTKYFIRKRSKSWYPIWFGLFHVVQFYFQWIYGSTGHITLFPLESKGTRLHVVRIRAAADGNFRDE